MRQASRAGVLAPLPLRAHAASCALMVAVVMLGVVSPATATAPGRNGLIAFVAHTQSAAEAGGIAVVRPDGRGMRKLSRNPSDRSPAWSPDGRRLVFERRGQIYVINGDGTGLRRVTRLLTDAREPAWSPEGRQIVFTREARAALLVVNADGTGQRVLFSRGIDDTIDRPAWSPDGRWIAFGLREYGAGSIAMIRRDGRFLRYVTDGRVEPDETAAPGEWADDHTPDWSPDGSRILFTRVVWLCPRCDQEEIFSVKADGSDVRWVTRDQSYASSRPSWSPDGNRIVAETSAGIAIFDVTGKRLRILDRLGTEPAWQPLRRTGATAPTR